ncbi:DUF433 domain-containing protein [Candidatus Sumerlaeota bacterium]|nr:DUF433 domain-containing protein [Candidatus Sumerlaeota bacterium]
MDWRTLISVDRNVMHGTACFTGTRIPVSVVLDNLAAGETNADILREYPSLREDHIRAAISSVTENSR